MTKPVRYDGAITLRAAPEIIKQIHVIAKRRGTKPSEWIRNAVSLALQIERGDAED
jgi:hypothetical protein